MSYNKSWIVYIHIIPKTIRKQNNDKYYVGITSQRPKERWRKGKGYLHNKNFTNAINKYGWENIEHEIIAEHLTKEEAKHLEIVLINKLNSTNKQYGYNKTKGGDTSYLSVRKLSSENQEKFRITARNLGLKMWQNEEFRNNHSGHNCHFHIHKYSFPRSSNAAARKCICLNTLKIFDCILDGANYYNLDYKTTEDCCLKRVHVVRDKVGKAYVFRYYEDYLKMNEDDIRNEIITSFSLASAKYIIELDNHLLYTSAVKASKYYECTSANIQMNCKGKTKTAKSHHFQYFTDYILERDLLINKAFSMCKLIE